MFFWFPRAAAHRYTQVKMIKIRKNHLNQRLKYLCITMSASAWERENPENPENPDYF
jgi:hypothetical protein